MHSSHFDKLSILGPNRWPQHKQCFGFFRWNLHRVVYWYHLIPFRELHHVVYLVLSMMSFASFERGERGLSNGAKIVKIGCVLRKLWAKTVRAFWSQNLKWQRKSAKISEPTISPDRVKLIPPSRTGRCRSRQNRVRTCRLGSLWPIIDAVPTSSVSPAVSPVRRSQDALYTAPAPFSACSKCV